MPTVERENIDLLTDKITVKIQKQDYLPSFEKKLKEYSKTANIPGFRKGMVPVGMIRKMYGASILSEEVLKTVEKQLNTYLSEEKPSIFGQPLPLEADFEKINPDRLEDYHFDFEIGLKPEFVIPDLTKADFTFHKIAISEQMLDEEIENMRAKAGYLKDVAAVQKDEDNISGTLSELTENTIASENADTKAGSIKPGQFTDTFRDEVRAIKVNESIDLIPAEAFEGEQLDRFLKEFSLEKADAEKRFRFLVSKINTSENAEMDEAFFQKIFPGKNLQTEAEFRSELKSEMQSHWDSQSRNQLHDQIYHLLIDETRMDFPESFLKRWLRQAGEKPKTAEEAEKEFPGFSNQLKWTLISERLTTENDLDISKEELQDGMRKEVMNYFGQMNLGEDTAWLDSYIDRMMKDEKHVDATYRRLISAKLFDWLEKQIHPLEQPITPEKLASIQHHHQR